MRSFTKYGEPKVLKDFRNALKENVDPFQTLKGDDKDIEAQEATLYESEIKARKAALYVVQSTLASETGFVCCYCQKTLETRTDEHKRFRVDVEIEHFKPKSIFKSNIGQIEVCGKMEKNQDLRIDYNNLLATCQTSGRCGNLKGDTILCQIPNPATTKIKDFPKFRYSLQNGKIQPPRNRPELKAELENVLGLNQEDLYKSRWKTWLAVRNTIKKQFGITKLHTGGNKEIDYVKDLIKKYENRKDNSHFYQFYDCIVYLLKLEYKKSLG